MVVRACLFDWVRKRAAILCFVLFYFVCLFVCLVFFFGHFKIGAIYVLHCFVQMVIVLS